MTDIRVCTRHDILEGIGKKELKLLLAQLIQEKYITLQELNDRIVNFSYW